MADLFGWAKNIAKGPLLNLAIAETAGAFAAFIDEEEITPEDLEQMIAVDAPVFKAALAQKAKESPGQLSVVRNTFGAIAADFRKTHHAPDGTPWHPYKAVLQEDCMGKAHPEHVAVLEQHQLWYKRQMDDAMAWLFGTAPE